MPAYAFILLIAGWLVWLTPFLRMKRNKAKAEKIDKRARWGIIFTFVAFSIVFQPRFWEQSPPSWRLAVALMFFILASALSWTAARSLGRQWRIDAGLNADHLLVTTGPYQFVRHPIYTSMLCLVWAVGFLLVRLPWLALATVFALIGTEIRTRVEDGLLRSRFGQQFDDYKRSVPGYLPGLR